METKINFKPEDYLISVAEKAESCNFNKKTFEIIIKAYDEHFFMNPNHLKVYTVNQKLRELETPNLKDFTIDVLKGLTINTEKKKLTRSQRVKQESDLYVKKWALGQVKLGKKSA